MRTKTKATLCKALLPFLALGFIILVEITVSGALFFPVGLMLIAGICAASYKVFLFAVNPPVATTKKPVLVAPVFNAGADMLAANTTTNKLGDIADVC